MSTEERDRKAIDLTWRGGWHIRGNPQREPGKFTEREMEVIRLASERTPQQRQTWRTKTYAYEAPFNYPNVQVELGRPGVLGEFNSDGVELDVYPYGYIVVEETEPIVSVTVIGSGCSYHGYVVLEAEPFEWKYPRTGVRMWRGDLWGEHVVWPAWKAGITENYNDAGLSSARFDIPESRKLFVGGGSHPGDPHYCIRIVRVEVREPI